MSRLNFVGFAAFFALSGSSAWAQPQADLTPQAARADFSELYRFMEESHFDMFARRSKAEYDREYARISATLNAPQSAHALRVTFQKFLAYGQIAHANIDFPSEAFSAYREAGGKTIPLFPRIDGNTIKVAEQYGGNADIRPGDDILAIDGIPILTWIARLSQHISADNPYMAGSMIETRFPALFWLEAGPADNVTLSLTRAGKKFDASLPARTRPDILAAMAKQPKTLELDPMKRVAQMHGEIAYLRPGYFLNVDGDAAGLWDNRAFKAYADRAFEDFIAAGATSLLIDLRDNPGGDNSFSDLIVQWFADRPFRFCKSFTIKVSAAAIASNAERLNGPAADSVSRKLAAAYAAAKRGDKINFDIPIVSPRAGQRFTGRVYILVNRRSYSNSVQVAAMAQDYKFATILGEETADLATTYGAMEGWTLGNSRIRVNFPKALIVRVNGDLRPRGVVPDISIPTPLVQGMDDPVLIKALAAIRATR